MIHTVFYSLIFDYNIKTMESSGRHWASSAYKNKDHIFSYSAASIATVLHHNPIIDYRIMTDDPNLLKEKLTLYGVEESKFFDGLTIYDNRENIQGWKSSKYCFWPLIKSMDLYVKGHGAQGKRVVKLDNDLTALKPLDERFYAHQGSHVWKFERSCDRGREYWGERLAARTAFGTDVFNLYNTGVWSVHPDHHLLAREIPDLCVKASDVDISSVSYFPDNPGVKAKTWACSDQTSNNFWLHKHSVPVMETTEYFTHHCYVNNKDGVLKDAEFLLKKKV